MTAAVLPPLVTLDDFDLDGYVAGFPTWVKAEIMAIDSQIAHEAECTRCGAIGLAFAPYHHRDRGHHSYRAFALCPECGHAEEF